MRSISKILSVVIILLSFTSYATEDVNTKLVRKMYSSDRAWRKGDILTIIVDESVASSKQEDISTSQKAAADTKAATVSSPETHLGKGTKDLLNNLTSVLRNVPAYSIDSSNSYSGKGSMSASEKLNLKFAARVVDVLDNGVLVIRGDRKVRMRDEEFKLIATGLVRPVDISADNSIESSKVADAHITYVSSGEVTRGSQPGWLWRSIQWLNPF